MGYAVEFAVPESVTDNWDFSLFGKTHFKDSVWDLTPLLNNKRTGVYSMGRLNYNLLKDKPLAIEPIKRYFYIRLGQVKPQTVALEYNRFACKLIDFMNMKSFDSLESFNTEYFIEFNIWLKRHYYKNEKSSSGLATIANILLQIISIGQSMNYPLLPDKPILLEVSVWDWWGVNKQGKLLRQVGAEDKSIPMPIWKQIIQKAWEEPNVTQHIKSGLSAGLFKVNNAKFGILIQAYTGLRISEVVYLKKGCVEKDSTGKCWLNAVVEKTEDEPTNHKILIPEQIYYLILELDTLTEPLRLEADETDYLFYILSRRRKKAKPTDAPQRDKPKSLESGKWNHYVLRPFLQRNSIPETFQNSQNHTIRISSHCFRHTFAKVAIGEMECPL